MPWLLLGALAFVIVMIAMRAGSDVGSKASSPVSLKKAAGFVLGALALAALLREQVLPAMVLGGAALVLTGVSRRIVGGLANAARARLQSRMLAMTLDPRTGAFDGTVREGSFRGRRLLDLGLSELLELRAQCEDIDADGFRLLDVYLDRRFGTQWREDRNAGGRDRSWGSHQAPQTSAAMTREEAYAILGLKPGASTSAIKDAHRRLMLKLHPDQGGSTYLAAKINRAREILLDP